MSQKPQKRKSLFTRKTVLLTISIIVILLIISGWVIANRTKTQINEIFKFNEELKIAGYYLSDFEFEMLGTAYYLDHGQYLKALAALDKIHHKFKTREGLIKVPEFASAEEKLAFYLNLQNPTTGAFHADDSFPPFVYIGSTANMVEFIETLHHKTKQPFRLKYPLKFLDEINTPEKLIAMLEELSRVGWLGAKFKTPFVCLAELRALIEQDERLDIYAFSPELKQSFYQWCYDSQDAETGLWGSRWRKNDKLLNGGTLDDSEKIIKQFVDHDGNEIHPEFPLKYRDKMFASALAKLSVPMPDDLDELHDWILVKNRGLRFLTRYLWRKASSEEKAATRKLIEEFVGVRFAHYYIKDSGAFSLYPKAAHADLDGTGEALGMFKYTGALSEKKQKLLWGDPKDIIVDLGSFEVSDVEASDFVSITSFTAINSIRLYRTDPNQNYIENVATVFYPRETSVLDLVDLLPKLQNWVKTTPQNMGNWITKENIMQTLSDVNIEAVAIAKKLPLASANELLQKNGRLIVVGFDVLQVPRYQIVFKHPG